MLLINGGEGEGGGQILRSSLALSLALERPFRIVDIRPRRPKPGLRPQHLACVRAAMQVSGARVEGLGIGSTELLFEPGPLAPGGYRFDIGTAGSTTLLLQTLLPALCLASQGSRLALVGGTHNPLAPPYDFLRDAYLPLLTRVGLHGSARLLRPGFYPSGGGMVEAETRPAAAPGPLFLLNPGRILSIRAQAMVAKLPRHIALRELKVIGTGLGLDEQALEVCESKASRGPGNALLVRVNREHVSEVFCAFGERGVPAESVAEMALGAVRRYLQADVALGEHLADQLLPVLALVGGGRFTTVRPSPHFLSNVYVVRAFTGMDVGTSRLGADAWEVQLGDPRQVGDRGVRA